MIKFFRNIRQNLLTENKFNKYLIYAIGEITLVSIGILIALGVNNWNESKKRTTEEQFILSGLVNDIDQDISNLKYLIELDSAYLIANKVLLDAFKHDSIRENKDLLKYNIVVASMVPSFTASRTVFNQMESSGKINYIVNDSIRSEIQRYYDLLTEVMDYRQDNIKIIHELSTSALKYLDFNSSVQILLPEYAQIELDDFDNSLFYEPLTSSKTQGFADLITTRQLLMYSIDEGYFDLLQEGKALKRNLIKYKDTN